ncbi:MAG: hypothetical protein WA432_04820 [Candidatus Babeliaceae bacterium]
MKKQLFLLLLCGLIDTRIVLSKVTKIDSPILQTFESLVKIDQIIFFMQFIHGLQHGFKKERLHYFGFNPEHFKQEGDIIKVFIYEGKYYNLKELVELAEQTMQKYEHLKNTNHKQFETLMQPFKEVLEKVIQTFELIAEPYLNQVRGARLFMIKLIDQWSKQTQKLHTYLLAWNKHDTNEKEHIRNDLTTLKAFDIFLNDLKHFLNDLVHSCPTSYAKYKQKHKHKYSTGHPQGSH